METLTMLFGRGERALWLWAVVTGVVAAGYPSYVYHPVTLTAPVLLLAALVVLLSGEWSAARWAVGAAVIAVWFAILYVLKDGTLRGLVYSWAMYAPWAVLAFRMRRVEVAALSAAVTTSAFAVVRVVASWVQGGAEWRPWRVDEGSHLAMQLTLLVPLLLVVAWRGASVAPPRWRWLRAVPAGAAVVAVAMTMQRAALGLLAVTLVIAMVRLRPKSLLLVAAAGALAWVVAADSIRSVLERLRVVNFVNSSATRPEIWRVALRETRDSGWLGVGPGNSDDSLASLDMVHAHNGLVQSLLEAGIVGGVLFIAVAGWMLVCAVRLVVRGGPDVVWALPLVAYLGFSVVSAPLQRPDFTLIVVLVLAVVRERLRPSDAPCSE